MGRDHRQDAYQALRGVLQGLRDRLTVQEAADLSAQLPFLLRGVFYEAWNPAELLVTIRDRDEFMEYIQAHMGTTVTDIPPRKAFHAVARVLERHTTEGQLMDVEQMLPEELRSMFAKAMAA